MSRSDLSTWFDLIGRDFVALLALYTFLGVGAWGLVALTRRVRQWKR